MFVLLFSLFSSTLPRLQLPPSSLPHHHFTILHHLLPESQSYVDTQQWSLNLLTALQFCRYLPLLYYIYSSCIAPGSPKQNTYHTTQEGLPSRKQKHHLGCHHQPPLTLFVVASSIATSHSPCLTHPRPREHLSNTSDHTTLSPPSVSRTCATVSPLRHWHATALHNGNHPLLANGCTVKALLAALCTCTMSQIRE